MGSASAWVLVGPGVADASCQALSWMLTWSLGQPPGGDAGVSPGMGAVQPASPSQRLCSTRLSAVLPSVGWQSQTRLSGPTADEKSPPVSETDAFTGVLHEGKQSL